MITWKRDALLKVHRGLLSACLPDKLQEETIMDTEVLADEVTVGHLTWLAQHDILSLRQRLKEVIPSLVEFLNWEEEDVDDLLDVLVDRCRHIGMLRFREAVGEWLEDYAQARSLPHMYRLSPNEWKLILYRSAIHRVRNHYLPGREGGTLPPGWVSDYFSQINRVNEILPRQLLNISVAGEGQHVPSGLPGFRRDVYDQVTAHFGRACREWEIA